MQPKDLRYRKSNKLVNYSQAGLITSSSEQSVVSEHTRVIPGVTVTGNKVDPTPWDYTCIVRRGPQGYVRRFYPNGRIQNSQDGAFDVFDGGAQINPPAEPSFDIPYNQALTKLNDQVRGGLDLAVDLAEAGQTAKMLNLTEQLDLKREGMLNWLSDSRRNRGLVGMKAISGMWLAYRYGVKPLLSSIYNCADESTRLVLNRIERFKAGSAVRIPNGKATFAPGGMGSFQNVTIQNSGIRAVTIGVKIQIPESDLARWTSLNPVSIAWELVPFSFVVDWVFNVGGYLNNLETGLLQNCRGAGLGATSFISQITAVDQSVNLAGTSSTGADVNVSFSQKYIQFNRSLSGYPLPRPPSFKVNLGSNQLLDSAALLAQLLNRR